MDNRTEIREFLASRRVRNQQLAQTESAGATDET
jgi:hypothetical protein